MGRAAGRNWLGLMVVCLLGALGFAGWALWRGENANWDLQNYHDYSAYALLAWRYPLNVGPGSFQGYFNPLPYLIPYALQHSLPAPLVAVGLALVQAAVCPSPGTWGAFCCRPAPVARRYCLFSLRQWARRE